MKEIENLLKEVQGRHGKNFELEEKDGQFRIVKRYTPWTDKAHIMDYLIWAMSSTLH